MLHCRWSNRYLLDEWGTGKTIINDSTITY
jgi:hypothetical protein